MDATQWTLAVLLGLGLASASGLNTFLPLLMLASAAHFHIGGVQLNGSYAWLAGDAALITLALATVLEIAGDKIPLIDHGLDVVGTVARPAAGALAAASVFVGVDPTIAAVLGLIIGAPTALGFHAAKAGTRAASSAATLGVGNPILSVLEDVAAFFMTLFSLLAPVAVPIILLIMGWISWKVFRAVKRPRASRA